MWVIMLKELWWFVCSVIKRIHSQERIICGIDGALGGILSYLFFREVFADLGVSSPIVIVLFGGLIGAVLGVIHWRLAQTVLLRNTIR